MNMGGVYLIYRYRRKPIFIPKSFVENDFGTLDIHWQKQFLSENNFCYSYAPFILSNQTANVPV